MTDSKNDLPEEHPEEQPEEQEVLFGVDDYQPITREDLPEVNDAILDDETVEQLFIDIGALGDILGVTARGHGPQTRGGEQNITLERARELFLNHDVNGLQIRYIHAGIEWWDTLMHTPAGTRLVRISHTWE